MGTNLILSFDFLGAGLQGYIVPFLIALSIVVFFHELGHFLIARACGIRVLVFSIGFGPEIVGFNDRKGTRWKISVIPLGGYVKFFGDQNASSVPEAATLAQMSEAERKVSFFHQPVWSRAAVVVAGPLANFILAIVILAGIFSVYGKESTAARVATVQPGSAAEAAGFQPGDLVVSIDGRQIESFGDLQRIIVTNPGQTLKIVVDRGGVHETLTATPAASEVKDNLGNVHRQGMLGIASASVAPGESAVKPVDPLTAVVLGVRETWFVIDSTVTYLARVVVGRESPDQLGGPIRIAQIAGQVWQGGLHNGGIGTAVIAIVQLSAILSVSIGLLNLFPIPLLDGGHLLFYAVEAVRGRPLSERAQQVGFRFGLAVVLMLMIFATYNDISQLFHWSS
jgi:regulator of sigma E protease